MNDNQEFDSQNRPWSQRLRVKLDEKYWVYDSILDFAVSVGDWDFLRDEEILRSRWKLWAVSRVNHMKCFSSRRYFYKSARNKPSINWFLLMIRLPHHAMLNLCQWNLSLKDEKFTRKRGKFFGCVVKLSNYCVVRLMELGWSRKRKAQPFTSSRCKACRKPHEYTFSVTLYYFQILLTSKTFLILS